LYRYDGYSLKRYESERDRTNSLGSDPIRFVYKDRDGALWIGNLRGVYRLDPADGTLNALPVPTRHIALIGR
jgi:ligand-binding sensor domain-containing protein